jgi:hypothetical protein
MKTFDHLHAPTPFFSTPFFWGKSAFSKPKLSGKNAKILRFPVILGGFSIKQYDQPGLEIVI